MSYTVKVEMPNKSKGDKVQVYGLGTLENGKTVRVSDEQADLFRRLNSTPVRGEDNVVRSELGPPLDEASFPEGITVTADGRKTTATSEEGSQ